MVTQVFECSGGCGLRQQRVFGQGFEVFRATPGLLAVLVQECAAHGAPCGLLVGRQQRGGHFEATRVSLLAIALKHHLTSQFSHMVGTQRGRVQGWAAAAHLDHFLAGLTPLRFGQFTQIEQTFEHQQLTSTGALPVGDGVGKCGVLRQPGQEGALGHGQLVQRLAQIHLCRRTETVGTVPQVNLVHVELQDVVLGQLSFHAPGQQRLFEFALQRAARGQKEVARNLLGDGGRTLRPACRQTHRIAGVHQHRTGHAQPVHALMLTKPGVFDGKHSVLQLLRHVANRNKNPPLSPKLGQLHAIVGEDLQVLDRLVVHRFVQRRQGRPPPSHGTRQGDGTQHHPSQQDKRRPAQPNQRSGAAQGRIQAAQARRQE